MSFREAGCLLLVCAAGLCLAEDLVVRADLGASPEKLQPQPLQVDEEKGGTGLEVTMLHVESSIKYRYAHSRVSCRTSNLANTSQEARFRMLLPETAFITSFLMETEGKQYRAFVKEKEAARRVYQEAVAAGNTAAHVHLSARNSNEFSISVNLEPTSKVLFVLTYEELLTRTLGLYSHVVNLNPGQLVRDLLVDVFIAEPSDIIELQVPKLRSSNEVKSTPEEENPLVEIRRPSKRKVHVRYHPSVEQQRVEGTGGQLVVRYDVERTNQSGGQILVNEGYFVHFFAPQGLPPLRKLAVFVLDLSGSMEGRKVEQLKEAMSTILDDLGPRDYFNIIDFSFSVTVHNLDSATGSVVLPPDTALVRGADLPPAYPTTPEYIGKAKQVIRKMSSGGGTNIYDALKNALGVAQSGLERIRLKETAPETEALEPIVIFLTDGEPTVGITKQSRILSMVKEYNYPRCSIFSLGFGDGADMKFLRRLSLGNAGFARSIYEASDAALQLSNFYKEVASPLLSNVTFTYIPGQVAVNSLTRHKFPSLFLGSELVIAGRLSTDNTSLDTQVEGLTVNGTTSFYAQSMRDIPDDISSIEYIDVSNKTTGELAEELKGGKGGSKKKIKRLSTNLERVWAYLSIQQLADQVEAAEVNSEQEKELRKQALALALKYKFVTPFTSLVVVKPNKTEEITNESMKPGESFKSKISYLHGALFGLPAHFVAHRVDQPSSESHMSSPNAPSNIDRIDIVSSSESSGGDSEEETEVPPSPRLGLEQLSWLQDVYFWHNSSLLLPSGDNSTPVSYLLLNSTTGEDEEDLKPCRTVHQAEGLCRHLTACVLSQFLDNITDYMNYFCSLQGGYAGVCCPGSVTPTTTLLYDITTLTSLSDDTSLSPQTESQL